MDPIRPIESDHMPPVQPVERRSWKDEEERERERRRRARRKGPPRSDAPDDEDDGRPHVDVRA